MARNTKRRGTSGVAPKAKVGTQLRGGFSVAMETDPKLAS